MEWGWLRKIDFFPTKPEPGYDKSEGWRALGRICLATKSRNLGDALVLTSLAKSLKRAHPKIRITTYPRGFNPIVFENSPFVDGVSHLPRAVYGDDVNEGGGNLINMKERFFELPLSPDPRPEIFLSDTEQAWAKAYLAEEREPARAGRPLVFIHPWGTTRKPPLSLDDWDALIRRYRDRYSFWQLGMEWSPAVVGCDHYVFLGRGRHEARKLFALMPHAHAFLGVDSGPMHVARAFKIPSLVAVTHSPAPGVPIQEWLKQRDHASRPLELSFAFLYSSQPHLEPGMDRDAACDRFFSAIS